MRQVEFTKNNAVIYSSVQVPDLRSSVTECVPVPLTQYLMPRYHRAARFGSGAGELGYSHVFHRQYPYGRAGFKPDGDRRGSYASIVTS